MNLAGRFGSLFFRIAYPFYYRRKLTREDHLKVLGFELTVLPGVFHPALFFSTRIFGRFLSTVDFRGTTVLEMGSGSGLLSLVAAARGAAVTSVDVNPLAVECTKRNVTANGLDEAVTVLEGDLFAAVPPGRRFDYILWNPPFYPSEPTDDASRAMKAGEGYHVLKRFAAEAGKYLEHRGAIFLILTGRASDESAIIGFFEHAGLSSGVVHEERSFFERFRVWRLRKTMVGGR